MDVEVHIAGATTPEEREHLEDRLRGMEHVQVARVEETRILLSYDPDRVTASDIQSEIEAAGGEVITLDPKESDGRAG